MYKQCLVAEYLVREGAVSTTCRVKTLHGIAIAIVRRGQVPLMIEPCDRML